MGKCVIMRGSQIETPYGIATVLIAEPPDNLGIQRLSIDVSGSTYTIKYWGNAVGYIELP